jgi:predicted NBD/HSP70 family sugar kinase
MAGSGRQGVRSPAIGSYNRGLVLETVRLQPGASRVEVAERTKLTAAAVSNIVRSLIDDGLIEETGRGASIGGKPRTTLQIVPGARYSLGIHLDPRTIFAVLVGLDGSIVAHRTQRLRSQRLPPAEVLDRAATLATSLCADIDRSRIAGAGVACPGPIDAGRGTIIRAPNMPGWDNTPIRDMLGARLPWPIAFENDANAAAIGEKWNGAAQHVSNFLYVYIGTGVGGAIFIDHHIYRGRTANAGAIGHLTIRENGRPCGCGNRGCLEAYCSQQAIVDGAGEIAGLDRRPETVARDHQIIARAAADGDPAARGVIAASARHLATGVASLVNVLDIDAVFLGGHVIAASPAQYVDAVAQAVADRPVAHSVQRIEVAASSHSTLAAAIGAAAMVLHDQYAPRIEV